MRKCPFQTLRENQKGKKKISQHKMLGAVGLNKRSLPRMDFKIPAPTPEVPRFSRKKRQMRGPFFYKSIGMTGLEIKMIQGLER